MTQELFCPDGFRPSYSLIYKYLHCQTNPPTHSLPRSPGFCQSNCILFWFFFSITQLNSCESSSDSAPVWLYHSWNVEHQKHVHIQFNASAAPVWLTALHVRPDRYPVFHLLHVGSLEILHHPTPPSRIFKLNVPPSRKRYSDWVQSHIH